MNWHKLSHWPEEQLWRGCVLRLLRSEHPYEQPVDLMLMESLSSPSGFALWVVTGYHAGCILRELPENARCAGNVRAISCRWLQENWQTEIYAGCTAGDVCIIGNYPAGIGIQTTAP